MEGCNFKFALIFMLVVLDIPSYVSSSLLNNKVICDSEIYNTLLDDISLPRRTPPCLILNKKRTKRVNDVITQAPNKPVNLNVNNKTEKVEVSKPQSVKQVPENVQFEDMEDRQGRPGRVGGIRGWGGGGGARGGTSRWAGRGSTQGRWTGRGNQPSRWTGRERTIQPRRGRGRGRTIQPRKRRGRGGVIRGFGGGGNWGGRGGLAWHSSSEDISDRMGGNLHMEKCENNLIWTKNNHVFWCNQYKCILIKRNNSP